MSETAILSAAPARAARRPLWRLPAVVAREWRASPGRGRVPEPMAMNDPESVARFHEGAQLGFGPRSVYDFNARALDALVPENGRLLDLGVGSGQALAWFLERRPDVSATGLDLSVAMLDTARTLFEERGLASRVRLLLADATALSDELLRAPVDAVSAVWMLHHLPDAAALDGALRRIAALRERHGAAIWIFDFQRLKSSRTFSEALAITEPLMHPVLAGDGIASEAAAFTVEEMGTAVARAGLGGIRSGVARPLPWMQAWWAPGRRAAGPRAARRRPPPDFPRLDALALRLGFSSRPF